MQTQATTLIWPQPCQWPWLRTIGHELHLSWQFISGDISSAIVPALLFLLAAWQQQGLGVPGLPLALGQCLLYFWLYLWCFCLANQLVGIEEDRLNKPHRPLVTGAVSYGGALRRFGVVMALYTAVGFWLGVLPWTLLWQTLVLGNNFGGWTKPWVGKHRVMVLGIVAQLAAAWSIAAPLTAVAWWWIGVMAGTHFFLIAVQDLRDIAGDRVAGRRTLPLVMGERATRWLLVVGFALQPLVFHRLLVQPANGGWPALLCSLLLALFSWTIALRIIQRQSPAADHQSYLLYTYWYCATLVAAIVIL